MSEHAPSPDLSAPPTDPDNACCSEHQLAWERQAREYERQIDHWRTLALEGWAQRASVPPVIHGSAYHSLRRLAGRTVRAATAKSPALQTAARRLAAKLGRR